MRRRSSTVTQTRTRSVSFSATLALALNRRPNGPTLQNLPTEILLEIVQTAAAVPRHSRSPTAHRLGSLGDDEDSDVVKYRPRLDHRTLRALALTSRVLAGLAHTVLYGAVSLDDLKHTALFARTVVDCAHRDITLSSTTSPITPTSPTSMAFSYVPASFAGKSTTRLALEYPFHDSPRASKGRHSDLDRFYAATGALLGLGSSAPSVVSPVLASLRTLIVDSCILEHHTKHTPSTGFPSVSPTPSELILHTYISWHTTLPSPLAPIASHLTHLTIACPPEKWSLPSATLAALGGAPTLTHLALVRRVNANEDNDAEFVRDVAHILSERASSLTRVVLVVLPDSDFSVWKDEREGEFTQSSDTNAFKDSLISPEIRILQAYLSATYIWTQFTALARTSPAVCVIPGMGDAWARTLRKSRKSGAMFESNVFHDEGRDLWSWARTYEAGRRAREEILP